MIFVRGDGFGPYRIEDVVSSGGMAEVYAARREGHGSFTKRVALKVIRPEYAAMPELAEIFQREAQTVADISHPGIAHVYDFGQIDGRLYLAMELVEGVPLSELVSAAERSATLLPADVALSVAGQLLAAIAHLHEAGPILHRDLKPSNVLATPTGSIKVVDFGLARRVGAEPSALTELGGAAGTPRYMAPEQGRGTSTPQSDVFSLGLLLLELFAAGTAKGAALLTDARAGTPRALGTLRPDLPVGLDGLVLRAVRLDPALRHPDAAAMSRRFADVTGDLDLRAGAARLGAIVRAASGARGSEAPTEAGPVSPRPGSSPRPVAATPPRTPPGVPPPATPSQATPPGTPPARESLRIASAPPRVTPRDGGELLGPEAACFRHLRDFPGKVKGALAKSVAEQFAIDHPNLGGALRAQLVPEYVRILDDGIVASSWYPEVFFCALLRASRRVVPPPSLEEEIATARRVFESMARRYHRLFLRVAGPSRLITMASRTWSLYHTIGSLVIEQSGPGFAAGALTDNPAMLEPGYAEGSLGSFWGALTLAGARDVSVSLQRKPPATVAVRMEWK